MAVTAGRPRSFSLNVGAGAIPVTAGLNTGDRATGSVGQRAISISALSTVSASVAIITDTGCVCRVRIIAIPRGAVTTALRSFTLDTLSIIVEEEVRLITALTAVSSISCITPTFADYATFGGLIPATLAVAIAGVFGARIGERLSG